MADATPLVVCPSCQKRLRVPPTAAGKRFRCPGCSNPLGGSHGRPGEAPEELPRPVAVVVPAPAPTNPFEFSDPSADREDEVDEPEADPEPEDADTCALCGRDGADHEFFLCTQHTEGNLIRWLNYPAPCCEACYDTVAGLQSTLRLLAVAMLAGIAIAVGAVVLWGNKVVPGFVVALGLLPLVAALVANGVVLMRRGALVARKALAPTIKRARAAFHRQTGIREVAFTPLATVKGDASDLMK
jgi:hypothetical protein